MQVIYCIFSPLLLGNFNRFSAESGKVTDGLPDGSTDEYHDVWMERNFSRFQTLWKLHPAILIGIFTMNLADG